MAVFIFDFDGVIVDSEISTFRLLQEICKDHSLVLPESALSQRAGQKMSRFIDLFFAETVSKLQKDAISKEFYDIFLRQPEKYIEPLPSTYSFLKNYNGQDQFAIASVGNRSSIDRILDELAIKDKFSLIVSSEDVKRLKPDPEIYRKTAQLLGVNPGGCRVFEDSIVGAQSAISAGCIVHVVLNGLNSESDFSRMPVASFVETEDDFLQLLKKA